MSAGSSPWSGGQVWVDVLGRAAWGWAGVGEASRQWDRRAWTQPGGIDRGTMCWAGAQPKDEVMKDGDSDMGQWRPGPMT